MSGERPVEILRLGEAARRLGMPTAELVQLVHDRKIEFVMVDGIARIASDVLERYQLDRSRAS
jgi:excisionase family DNA binding protein